MSNTCERCGGQKTAYFKIEPVYTNGFVSAAHAISASTMKICMCPPIKEKHDGKLGEDGQSSLHVQYDEVHSQSAYVEGIYLRDDYGDVPLTPKQALSLLAWLEQERDTLEELAQGQ